ncbi:MAG: hypothetical protein IJY57_02800 [Clostridia bacterium]|nr:hypothetical protein [Clostridia bacterium]
MKQNKSRQKPCISLKHSFAYHQGASLVYHHCEIMQPLVDDIRLTAMIYTLRVMIYHCFCNG